MPNILFQCLIVVVAVGGSVEAIAQEFAEDSTLRGEQLFPYDDQDVWKHGWIQVMPFYGGYHSFRPYNYKHVYAQSAQASRWGVSPQAPYSQQFWHQYESRTDLSLTEVAPTQQGIWQTGFQNAPLPAPPVPVEGAVAPVQQGQSYYTPAPYPQTVPQYIAPQQQQQQYVPQQQYAPQHQYGPQPQHSGQILAPQQRR